ncbi:MAG: M12 family metallo-peptidase [Planctomycetota bacterium]
MIASRRTLPMGGLYTLVLTLLLGTFAPAQSPLFQGLDLLDGSLQSLSFSEEPVSGVLQTTIDVGGSTWTLHLVRHSVRSDSFRVLTDDGSGSLQEVPAPPIVTWKGRILERPGSYVRAYYDGGELRATIHADDELVVVQPASDSTQAGTTLEHVVYGGADLAPLAVQCGVPDTAQLTPNTGPSGSGAAAFGPVIQVCEVGIDADHAYYLSNGSSITTTVHDIETIMNAVEGTYEDASIGITYEITTIVVRTVAGTYINTASSPLLAEFDTVWSSPPESLILADVAHLFTGKNLDGSIIGVARLSAICVSTNHFGLSQSKFSTNFARRVALTAHELGHNWSSPHCNGDPECRIMCSGLGGCNGLDPLRFTASPINSINNHKNSRTCLKVDQPIQGLPFLDQFAGGAISPLRWTHIKGAVISSAGVGEPSGTTSINLDSISATPYRDDEIRSNHIQLLGTSGTMLGYYTQHIGVDNGEQLIVEYLTSQQHWATLNTITSDGIDQTSFDFHQHLLPGNALHSEFRVRFRTLGDSQSDDWYIDDVQIVEGPIIQDPPEVTSVSPASGNSNGGQSLIIFGDKFSADAVAFIGTTPLLNQQLVGQTQIWGTTPPGVVGMASVSVSQTSGSDLLSPGYEYVLAVMAIESKEIPVNSSGNLIEVRADNSFDMQAYSLGLDYDSDVITVDSIDLAGTLSEPATMFGFVHSVINNDPGAAGGFLTLAVLMDTSPPILAVIPAGSSNVLANLNTSVSATAVAGQFTDLELKDTIGNPPVETIFATVGALSVSVRPNIVDGVIDFSASMPFIRSDSNFDGGVNVADAVQTLSYLFTSGSVVCLVALDANDDGGINIADAVYTLTYLFQTGPQPPAPFPNPGIDPTPDTLECVPAP